MKGSEVKTGSNPGRIYHRRTTNEFLALAVLRVDVSHQFVLRFTCISLRLLTGLVTGFHMRTTARSLLVTDRIAVAYLSLLHPPSLRLS